MRIFVDAARIKRIAGPGSILADTTWLCLLLIGCGAGCSDRHAPASPASDPVTRQWTEIAREQKMPEAVIEDVGALLEATLSAQGLTAAAVAHPDLRDSLRRFIPEFRHAFTSRKNGSDFSYYFVWLVAEAIQRGPSDRAALEAARADFRRCVEMYGARVQADFRAQLGEVFVKDYGSEIRRGIEWTRDTATRQFKMLQADPLFPSFKGPLNNAAIQAAIEHASSAGD